jgi:hypothetical protein
VVRHGSDPAAQPYLPDGIQFVKQPRRGRAVSARRMESRQTQDLGTAGGCWSHPRCRAPSECSPVPCCRRRQGLGRHLIHRPPRSVGGSSTKASTTRLGVGVREELEAFAAAERQCCAFVAWTVTEEASRLVLRVVADAATPDDVASIAACSAPDLGPVTGSGRGLSANVIRQV